VYPYRVFTLTQANHAVPEVAGLTARAQQRLEELRRAYHEGDAESRRALEAETRAALSGWQEAVLQLGAAPKGIFTVDFRSPDPNVLWCWTVEEPEITHRHFTWETFKDRIEIGGRGRAWPSRN
jgi:hypothetical protein